ncbi:hypothetical protein P692DRAFT_20680710, partial [Suillus brevipes Sb2]
FPWKTLPTVPACHCYILENYSENILIPSKIHAILTKSKCIYDDTLHEHYTLADVLKNDVLTVKSV